MQILVVGKGGREHALAEKFRQSPRVTEVFVAPGNAGMRLSGISCIEHEDPEVLVDWAKKTGIRLAVLGPEAAILAGFKEIFEKKDIPCLAPSAAAGKLESSKLFCKTILEQAQVPTARFEVAREWERAQQIIWNHNFQAPLVIKADGLAQGKGVAVCQSKDLALRSAEELSSSFGYPLLFEECLVGPELSAFALCDGEEFVLLGTACDYKRIDSNPFSANTGGMGAYSPCDFITAEDEAQIHEMIRKTLRTLKSNQTPYQGFLFAGLMKTERGLQVLEYNVRMGDPETQALMPRLKSDLVDLAEKAVSHGLKGVSVEFHPEKSVHVVMTSEGYPSSKLNLGHALKLPSTISSQNLYFAGVEDREGQLVNAGGRVLGVTALAKTKSEARAQAYQRLQEIHFQGAYYRKDIGE